MKHDDVHQPHNGGLKAFQNQLYEFTQAFQSACMGATENASKLATFMQGQRLHLVSRATPFAAANFRFARAADGSQKSKKKKKKRPEETSKTGKETGSKASKIPSQDSKSPRAESASRVDAEAEAEAKAAAEAKAKAAAEAKAAEQRLLEEEQEAKRKGEKQLAAERKKQEAQARRKATAERKREAKLRQEEADRKQVQEKQKAKEKEEQRRTKAAKNQDREAQKFLTEELKRIARRQAGESEFVRSLDATEFKDDDLAGDTTLTGLRPLEVEDLTEEHDEVVRELLAEAGVDEDDSLGLEEITLPQLLNKAEKEQKRQEMSADEPGYVITPPEQIYAAMQGEDLRPHAHKMQLKPEEHDDLELDRFGRGHFLHPKRLLGLIPWGVVHDISWGVFGRIPVVQERLGPKWGGMDPNVVLRRQDFYDDILNIAPEMEMTVMMVAERDIPLAELRNKLLDTQHIRLRQTLYKEDLLKPLAHKHRVLLAKIKLSAMEESFRHSGLIDSKGNIKQDSKLVLVVTEDGALTAEAVTPGTIVEQKVVRLGRWTDTTFARSVMDNFLGLYPADTAGKNAVGNGVLYCANGFDFRLPGPDTNPRQFYNLPPSEIVPDFLSRPQPQEGILLSSDAFHYEKQHPFVVADLSSADKRSEGQAAVLGEARRA